MITAATHFILFSTFVCLSATPFLPVAFCSQFRTWRSWLKDSRSESAQKKCLFLFEVLSDILVGPTGVNMRKCFLSAFPHVATNRRFIHFHFPSDPVAPNLSRENENQFAFNSNTT